MRGSASLTHRPANWPIRSSNVPLSFTGLMTAIPCSCPIRKSSSPNEIDVCTTPVPSSALTKSAGTTVWPFGPNSSVAMNVNGGS